MTRRYPLDALVSASGMSEAALARKVGMDRTTLRRAREHGLVETAADRFAIRAGFVPWLVWTDWLEELAQPCADVSCERPFVPARRNQIYCSPKCARRVTSRNYARRKYQNDPEHRQRKLERTRAYRDESREARLAKQRRYYRENADELRRKKAEYRAANRAEIAARQRARRERAA